MDRKRAVAEEALTDGSGEKARRKSMDGWRETTRSAREDGEITAEVDAESFLCERRGQAGVHGEIHSELFSSALAFSEEKTTQIILL